MVENDPLKWAEEDIKKLIADGREENINLDYKSSDALNKSDSKKNEISKDVSSFANSDGGIIIYGVKEYDENAKRHLPEKIDDGSDPADISKEWLEAIITSRIRPKIDGLIIRPIEIETTKKFIYLVYIPKSTTAHQAGDKRYYKRFNFESTSMEDYEIRDVMNRLKYPSLEPIFEKKLLPDFTGDLHIYKLFIKLVNTSSLVINNFLVELELPEAIANDYSGYFRKEKIIKKLKDRGSEHYIANVPYLALTFIKSPIQSSLVIFPKQEFLLLPDHNKRLTYKINQDIHNNLLWCSLYWRVFADNMPYKEGEIRLSDLSNF